MDEQGGADAGLTALATTPTARDFVSDAHAHCKFIGHTPAALGLIEAAGLGDHLDGGYVPLTGNGDINILLNRCAALRYWDREATLT